MLHIPWLEWSLINSLWSLFRYTNIVFTMGWAIIRGTLKSFVIRNLAICHKHKIFECLEYTHKLFCCISESRDKEKHVLVDIQNYVFAWSHIINRKAGIKFQVNIPKSILRKQLKILRSRFLVRQYAYSKKVI